ncbi:MAG: hypothetical protein JWP89_6843 [Schlesneria sp.]|nr:hypothetical protein [Schlesneria sp.]
MLLPVFAFALTWTSFARADDPSLKPASTEPGSTALKTKRAIILCGLSGDTDHHVLFSKTVANLHEGLCKNLGFAPSDVLVLFGDKPEDADAEVIKSAQRATREELEKSVAAVRAQLQAEDTLWVIVLGHAHYDGKYAWLNLPGPDIQQLEFAKLFHGLPASQQVFWMTTPASGQFIKTLSAKGRVVMSATDVDWETNETEFPQELAKVLFSPPADKEMDVDQDGVITLLDVYVMVTRNLAQAYLDRELLATEHPLLDDNGDGRGTEVQIDFLTVEQGGRLKRRKPAVESKVSTSDGQLANSIAPPFVRSEAIGSE